MIKRCIIRHLVKHILELQKDKGELTDRYKELEKKNAELKETYKKQRNRRIDELQKKNAELRKDRDRWMQVDKEDCDNWRKDKKLAEAKEILKKFLDAKSIEETCVAESEAEQFLEGIRA